MSNRKYAHQHAEVGSLATRLLTIPVMLFALLVTYFMLCSLQDEPALMADVARKRPDTHEPVARDESVAMHEALDPVGTRGNTAR